MGSNQDRYEYSKNYNLIILGEGEDCLSHNAVDLIKKLLNPDQTARLGTNGAQEIKEHPFFDGIK